MDFPAIIELTITETKVHKEYDGGKKLYYLKIESDVPEVAEMKKVTSWLTGIEAEVGKKQQFQVRRKETDFGIEYIVDRPKPQFGGKGGYQKSAPADPTTMLIAYAKDIEVAFVARGGEFVPERFSKNFAHILKTYKENKIDAV
jgi:hypothetical protein